MSLRLGKERLTRNCKNPGQVMLQAYLLVVVLVLFIAAAVQVLTSLTAWRCFTHGLVKILKLP